MVRRSIPKLEEGCCFERGKQHHHLMKQVRSDTLSSCFIMMVMFDSQAINSLTSEENGCNIGGSLAVLGILLIHVREANCLHLVVFINSCPLHTHSKLVDNQGPRARCW